MRIYKKYLDAVKEVERDLFEMGIKIHPESMQDKKVGHDPDYRTIELQGYGYKVSPIINRDSLLTDLHSAISHMNGNPDWAEAEFRTRINPRWNNPGPWNRNKSSEKIWKEFLRFDGTMSYTYQERISDQLDQTIELLNKNPNSRQGIITVYDKHQDISNRGGIQRVPCSLHYQFMVRNGMLDCIYSMRSCDLMTHFVHDVYFSAMLQLHISRELNMDTGYFTHFIGSLHAYAKDIKERNIF